MEITIQNGHPTGKAKNQFHPTGPGKVLKVASMCRGSHRKEIFEIGSLHSELKQFLCQKFALWASISSAITELCKNFIK